MDYETVITAIIEAEQEMIGDVALRIARRQEFLDVDDNGQAAGTTELTGDHVDQLLDAYEDVLGAAAAGNAKRGIAGMDVADLELPDRLRE